MTDPGPRNLKLPLYRTSLYKLQSRLSSSIFAVALITLRSLKHIQLQSFFLAIYFFVKLTGVFSSPSRICRLSIFSCPIIFPLDSLIFFSFLFGVLFGFAWNGSASASTIVTFNNISLRRFLILDHLGR